jgi:sortase A
MAAPPNAERFANLIIPRFGGGYSRPIAEGVGTTDVLNKGNIGHYPTTQMPGAPGNFALASHRSSGGGNFHDLHQMHVGDHIYVETPDGWYQYSFRNLEYVRPSGVGVLNPIPQVSGGAAAERYITLTTCNPFFSTAERIIAYGVYDSFYPRAGGVPAEIASNVTGAG